MTLLLTIILAIAIAILGIYAYKQNKKINKQKPDIECFEEENTEGYFRPIALLGKRKGNTTRLADFYIQELFYKKTVTLEDHHDTHEAHERLMKIVLKRLSIEHPHVKIKTHLGFKRIELV